MSAIGLRPRQPFSAVSLLAGLAILGLASCSAAHSSSSSLLPNSAGATHSSGARAKASSSKIQHVVIIIQENRSFNNLFMGYPGATTSTTGTLCNGRVVKLHSVPLESSYDVDHGLADFLAAYNNGAGGCFNHERYLGQPPKPKNFAYGFVPQSETGPYWAMAGAYTLADQMYPSNLDSSYTSHQYLIAAQAQSSVDVPSSVPWGCDGSNEVVHIISQQRTITGTQTPCFSYSTLATELDTAGLTWRFYAPPISKPGGGGIWSAFDSIAAVRYGPEWTTNVISPETTILTDIPSGNLANVTWVVPDARNSDHAGFGGNGGPQWVASIVDAVGQSQFWNSTAIFVVWDDWGGWYDPVVPKYVDYDGLGFRVPLIAISPYALPNHVAHTQYEFGTILRYVEDNWGLPRLAASDARAHQFGKDVFNYNQPPTPFTPFAEPGAAARFIHEQPSYLVPDAE